MKKTGNEGLVKRARIITMWVVTVGCIAGLTTLMLMDRDKIDVWGNPVVDVVDADDLGITTSSIKDEELDSLEEIRLYAGFDNLVSEEALANVKANIVYKDVNEGLVELETLGSDSEYDNLEKPTKDENGIIKIRCTVYTDKEMPMASGKKVYDGALAGKESWLGLECRLYKVNEDGSMGELIGNYKFEDTGYGIESNDGSGSIENGDSIDMWKASTKLAKQFIKEYGDYVYLEFIYH